MSQEPMRPPRRLGEKMRPTSPPPPPPVVRDLPRIPATHALIDAKHDSKLPFIAAALGGFAVGLVAALGVAAVINKPGEMLNEARAQAEALAAEKAALADQLGEAKAEADKAESEHKEMLALAGAIGYGMGKQVPSLGQFEAFAVKVIFTGAMEGGKDSAGAERAIGERLEAMGLPTVPQADGQKSATALLFVNTVGRFQFAGTVNLVVAVKLSNDQVVYLYTESTTFLCHADDLAKEVSLAADDVGLAFKKTWQKHRADGLGATGQIKNGRAGTGAK